MVLEALWSETVDAPAVLDMVLRRILLWSEFAFMEHISHGNG